MPFYTRKVTTSLGTYYSLKQATIGNYFCLEHADALPTHTPEIIVCQFFDGQVTKTLQMSILEGKDDQTSWYWFHEDTIKQMCLLEKSFLSISTSAAKLFKELLNASGTPLNPELLIGITENKEKYKDIPMEPEMCLALAMATHPRLGAGSFLNILAYKGITFVRDYKFDPNHNWAKRPCPWAEGQAKVDAIQKLGCHF